MGLPEARPAGVSGGLGALPGVGPKDRGTISQAGCSWVGTWGGDRKGRTAPGEYTAPQGLGGEGDCRSWAKIRGWLCLGSAGADGRHRNQMSCGDPAAQGLCPTAWGSAPLCSLPPPSLPAPISLQRPLQGDLPLSGPGSRQQGPRGQLGDPFSGHGPLVAASSAGATGRRPPEQLAHSALGAERVPGSEILPAAGQEVGARLGPRGS